eukprot:TRINITY_DN4644_c0_g1_i1.p1 TRINITY_DN4644_c0_g1~~TRINITY_DN4644_c0_g1_i1.p1  ORF type:complete len:613 (+),score=163.87 TRINITY_DN4644_c0_g1_i1:67-1839(+)
MAASCEPFAGAWTVPAAGGRLLKLPVVAVPFVTFRDDCGDLITFSALDGEMSYSIQRSHGLRETRPPFKELVWDAANVGLRMPDIGKGFAVPSRDSGQLAQLLGGLRSLALRSGIRTNIGEEVRLRRPPEQSDVSVLRMNSNEDRHEAVLATAVLRRHGCTRISSTADACAAMRRRLLRSASIGSAPATDGGDRWERTVPSPVHSDSVSESTAAERGRAEPCVRMTSRLPRKEQLQCTWLMRRLVELGVSAIGSAGGLCASVAAPCGAPPADAVPFVPVDPFAALLWAESKARGDALIAEASGRNALRIAEWECREDIRAREEERARQAAVQSALEHILKEMLNYQGGTAVMLEKSLPTVEGLARTLRENPEVRMVSIEGHVNPVNIKAGDVTPRSLSLARADCAREKLVERGIEAERLQTQGFGAERPLTAKTTGPEADKNRRVEFKVLKVSVARRQMPQLEVDDDVLLILVLLAACCVPFPSEPPPPPPPFALTQPDSLFRPADRGLHATALVDHRCGLASAVDTEQQPQPDQSASPVSGGLRSDAEGGVSLACRRLLARTELTDSRMRRDQSFLDRPPSWLHRHIRT